MMTKVRLMFALALCAGMPLMYGSAAYAEATVPQSRAEIALSFAPLVKQAAPAVVNIYARRVVEARQSPFAADPFFQDFFRDFGSTRPQVQNSLGSGVILSGDGIAVTNYHVVGQADDIRVVLNDRRQFDAAVLLADEEADIAILQITDAVDMPFLPLRDSDGVEVGELVLAIGNPFGIGQTVSSGIVSGLARSGTATGNARGYFIQTDAPINPGNSGGALIDLSGALIGVNTSILSRSGGSNGIGFAIPASLVRQFVAQARAGGTVFRRPWAGLNGQPVDAEMAESLGMDRPGGIVISSVHDDSPFRVAGIKPGDVILSVSGQGVNIPAEMVYRMSVAGEGAEVPVTVFSNGETKNVTVRLTAAPERPPRMAIVTGTKTPIPGLGLAGINPAVLAEFGLPMSATGVVITDPGAVGTRAGLRRGDVIIAVNGTIVSDSQSANDALEATGKWLALDVMRGLERLSLRFRL